MKLLSRVVVMIAVSIAISITANGQCNSDEFIDGTISKLGKKYTYFKSRIVEIGQGDRLEFGLPLTKGQAYSFITVPYVGDDERRLVFKLFDRRDHMVATNVVMGEVHEKITFPCNKKGKYRIEIYFQDGEKVDCGAVVIGYRTL